MRITSSPTSGLSNRFLGLVSHFRLSKIYGREFSLFWNYSPECSFPLGSYLDLPFSVTYTNYSLLSNNPIIKHPILTRSYTSNSELQNIVLGGWHHALWDVSDMQQIINIRSHVSVLNEDFRSILISLLNPTRFLSDTLRYFPSSFDIGIHIRRYSDYENNQIYRLNDWSKPNSSLLMDSVLSQIQAIDKVDTIFLSSPDLVIAGHLSARLRSKGYEVINTISLQKYRSLQECLALVDFMLFSRCKSVIRRYDSSFAAVPSVVNCQSSYVYDESASIHRNHPALFHGASL